MRSSSSRRVRRSFRPLLVERLERRLNPGFLDPLAYAAGDGPYSVAVGDFDGDGLLDLAMANLNSHNVSVLLGTGDGAFGAARHFSVGSGPSSGALGDFDGDGPLDLAVANSLSHNVSVLQGNGEGTFQTTHVSYVAGSFPASVAVVDFNGDGFPDLAIANFNSDDVWILLKDGAWPGPGPSPGGGRSSRGGIVSAALDGFAAEVLASRLIPAVMSTHQSALPAAELPLPARRDERATPMPTAAAASVTVPSRQLLDELFAALAEPPFRRLTLVE